MVLGWACPMVRDREGSLMPKPNRLVLTTLVGPWLVRFVPPPSYRNTGGWVEAENLLTGEILHTPKDKLAIAAIAPYELWPEFAKQEKSLQDERLF